MIKIEKKSPYSKICVNRHQKCEIGVEICINTKYGRCYKKPPMCQIMRFSLYCLNGSIEGRHINQKNSYVCNSDFIASSVLLEFF